MAIIQQNLPISPEILDIITANQVKNDISI